MQFNLIAYWICSQKDAKYGTDIAQVVLIKLLD